jgi:hypothetical protein
MKIIAFLLALLILAMAIDPCGDVDGTCGNSPLEMTDENIDYRVDISTDTDDEHDDDCNPFCLCQCCHVSFDLPSQGMISFPQIELVFEKIIQFDFHYSYHYAYGIWHPPSTC